LIFQEEHKKGILMAEFRHYINTIKTKIIEKYTPVIIENGIRFYCPSFLTQ